MSPNLDDVIRQLRSLKQDFEDDWSLAFSWISGASLSVTYLKIMTCFQFIAILGTNEKRTDIPKCNIIS